LKNSKGNVGNMHAMEKEH